MISLFGELMTRIPKAWLWIVPCCLIACSITVAEESKDMDFIATQRKRLVHCLSVRDPVGETANRAAQQLAVLEPDKSASSEIVRAILNRANDPHNRAYLRPAFVEAIVAQREFGVDALVDALSRDDLSDEAYVVVLSAIGRLGPRAAAARPMLRQELVTKKRGIRFSAATRAVLGNVGDSQEALASRIAGDLASPDIANAEVTQAIFYYHWVMSWMQPRGVWVNQEVIRRFTGIIAQPTFLQLQIYSTELRRVPIICAVSDLDGKLADEVTDTLENALKSAFSEETVGAIELALSLSRVRPDKCDAILAELCQRLPQLKPQSDPIPFLFMHSESAYLLVTDKMAEELAELVASQNEAVSTSAAKLLLMSGIAGRAAVPKLLTFIRSNAPALSRERAATTLGHIADISYAEMVKATLNVERTNEVTKALEYSLRMISQTK
jgi:uncharacterized coiled-coil protein SlyX